MSLRTQLFSVLPWAKGLNTTQDESLIEADELTVAENVIFGLRASRKKREGIDSNWDNASTSSLSIIGLQDFWMETGGQKTHQIVSVQDDGSVHSINSNGIKIYIGTCSSTSISRINLITFSNRVFLSSDNTVSRIHLWDGGSSSVIQIQDHALFMSGDPLPPRSSILGSHIGRLWSNDKDAPDRLHYSETGNPFKWGGAGDSGAIDIGFGDGDPEGITAIFPTFRGQLFVAKRNKLYRIDGDTPETFIVTLVSGGVGCISARSVVSVDTEDVLWVSERGIHSLNTTANYGDFQSGFASANIQQTFNSFERSRLKFTQADYLPTSNVVAFTFSSELNTFNDQVYLYNTVQKAWFVWPNVPCQSIRTIYDSDTPRFYFGRNDGRISKAFDGNLSDTDTSGNSTAIIYDVKTGRIFLDKNPYTLKKFIRLGIIYAPIGTSQVLASFKIDDFIAQSFSFENDAGTDLLGITFILDQSVLGSSKKPKAITQPLDGYGYGFSLEIQQTGTEQEVEILGFMIEWEPAGTKPEVQTQGS